MNTTQQQAPEPSDKEPRRKDPAVEVTESKDGTLHMVTFDIVPGYGSRRTEQGDAIDWQVRFTRQREGRPPFNEGELVRASCFVDRDSEGRYHLLTDFQPVCNGCRFYLDDSFSQDALAPRYGHQLTVIVRVNDLNRPREPFHALELGVELYSIEREALLNPPVVALQLFHAGQYVVLEGEVNAFEVQSASDKSNWRPGSVFTVATRGGTHYAVDCRGSTPLFTGGEFEHITHKRMEVGDRVRLVAAVRNPAEGETAAKDEAAHALFFNAGMPCLLLSPSESRVAERRALEARHAALLETAHTALELEPKDYRAARVALAALHATEPTKEVERSAKKLLEAFPDAERPVQFADRPPQYSATYQRVLGITLEQLTRDELVAIIKQVLDGTLNEPAGSRDRLYKGEAASILIESDVAQQQKLEVIREWSERTVAHARLGEPADVPSETNRASQSSRLFSELQDGFMALRRVGGAKVYEYLVHTFLGMVENGEHTVNHWMNGNMAYSLAGTIKAISHDATDVLGSSRARGYAQALEACIPALAAHPFIDELGTDILKAVRNFEKPPSAG